MNARVAEALKDLTPAPADAMAIAGMTIRRSGDHFRAAGARVRRAGFGTATGEARPRLLGLGGHGAPDAGLLLVPCLGRLFPEPRPRGLQWTQRLGHDPRSSSVGAAPGGGPKRVAKLRQRLKEMRVRCDRMSIGSFPFPL